jgi:hypothetical protein
MELTINDITIILGLDLLDQNTINSLTETDLKKSWHKTMKLYHSDGSSLDDEKVLNDNLAKVINNAYSQSLLNISELRKTTHKSVEANEFNSSNYPNIFKPIISKVSNKNDDVLFLLRSLRAIDAGMIIPSFLSHIGNIYGPDFLSLFIYSIGATGEELEKSVYLMQSHLVYLDEFSKATKKITEGVENQNSKSSL